MGAFLLFSQLGTSLIFKNHVRIMSDSPSALLQNRMVPFKEGLGREAYVRITLRSRELLRFTKETYYTVLPGAKLY